MSGNSIFTYSSAVYDILSCTHFEYPNIRPPLVKKSWLEKLDTEVEEESTLSTIAKKIKLINCVITRRRGRPTKNLIKDTPVDIVDENHLTWFSDASESLSGGSDIEWGDIAELDSVVPEDNIRSKSNFEIPYQPEPVVSEAHDQESEVKRDKKNKTGLFVEAVKSASGIYYPCPDCEKRFKALSTLRYHYKIHSGDLLHCEICARGFTNKYLLKCHQRVHTGELFTCNDCGKGFTTAELLKVHRRCHSGEKPFFCDKCSKSFRSASNLGQHKETHLSEKRFLCPQCGASFNQKRCLEGHMVVHGEKNQICTVCGKQWARKADLVEHMRIHTGQKPFKCKFCDLKFSQASSLKRHALTHLEVPPYPCQICEKKFRSETYYLRHLNKHLTSNQET